MKLEKSIFSIEKWKFLENLKKLLLMTIIIKIMPFNQEDIVVAIGIIINPILLKKITLIKMLTATDKTDILNGVLVSFLANKKLENIFINENAGKPREK